MTKEVDAVYVAYAATIGVQFGKPDAGRVFGWWRTDDSSRGPRA